jgi:hypothetical protein
MNRKKALIALMGLEMIPTKIIITDNIKSLPGDGEA